ncbi:hypothetical protein DPMN_181928 [Dreissena polymorpha]|uniref:Uncharacterized protein n=1 Tax=Dreissena polymorpha TaxID=45954 RepID=A0A9D4DEK3_DREPO|nr:hypothetical protein DPMN_181928 [Dreissena polymorpha]
MPGYWANIGTNLLIKFHEDRKINMASRVLTRKNSQPPGSHFHENRTINVASRVNKIHYATRDFKNDRTDRQTYRQKDSAKTIYPLFFERGHKNAPPLGSHANLLTKFHEDWTINVASRVLTRKMPRPWWPYIIGTNLLSKFHEDWTINVASSEKCPAPGGNVFQPTRTIFQLVQDINGTNHLTEIHEDQTINMTTSV